MPQEAVLQNLVEFVPFKGDVTASLEDRLKGTSQEDLKDLARRHQETIETEIPGLNPSFVSEGVYTLAGTDYDTITGATRLTLGLTTGTMAKALQNVYKGSAPGQIPIAVQGIVITSDNHIVLGVRSKLEFRASLPDEPFDYKIMVSPAGYATFKPNDPNPLEASYYKELKEELGLTKDDVATNRMMGYNRDIEWIDGIRISFLTHINLKFEDLLKRREGAEHKEEYIDLIGLKNDRASIEKFLRSSDFSEYSKQAKGLLEICVRPPLTHYAQNFDQYNTRSTTQK